MAKRILVVDDGPDIMKVVVFRLRKAGYEIANATNGLEALDLLERGETVDLIRLDLVMPVADGYEFCRSLRGDAGLCAIPVIILSASATRDTRERVKELGARDYIVKPFEPERPLARVGEVLAGPPTVFA